MTLLTLQESNKTQINNHLFIALTCIPIYIFSFGGEPMKYILAPYILYLVISLNANFFPALLVHFMMGTTISFVILAGCLFLTIQYWKLWFYKYKLGIHFIVLLVVFLILIISTKQRIQIEGLSIVQILDSFALFVGLFAFFYGILIYNQITKQHLRYIFLCLSLALYVQLITQYSNVIRYTFYLLPFITCLIISFLQAKRKDNKTINYINILNLPLVILSYGGSVTFTLFLTSLLSSIFIFSYFKKLNNITKYLPIVMLMIISFMVFYSINSYQNLMVNINSEELDDLSFNVSDFDSNKQRFLFKLFGDRAPIWKGVFEEFVLNGTILPPLSVSNYDIITLDGNTQKSEIAAHNIALELIRNYGILVGVILSGVYISFALISSKILKTPNLDSITLSIGACIIPIAIVGGAMGQYTLMVNFSFMFFGLMGYCFGKYKNLLNYD